MNDKFRVIDIISNNNSFLVVRAENVRTGEKETCYISSGFTPTKGQIYDSKELDMI